MADITGLGDPNHRTCVLAANRSNKCQLKPRNLPENHVEKAKTDEGLEKGRGCRREIENSGAGDRDRTGDIQLGKLAFYR
jgi:hypothetical protein